NKTATPGLLNFIKVAVQSFAGWVDMLSNQGEVIIEAGGLIAAAQQIENGLDSEMRLTASSASELPALVTDSALVSTAPSAPAPTPSEKVVVTGEATLYSSALFNIASAEVKQNIAVLHQQLDELRTALPPVVQYDFMRAAHTLAGVSRTMGFAAVVELAYALEGWLQARLEQLFTLSDGQLQMLEQSIIALDGMIQSICDKEMPQMRSDLVNQLLADKDNLSGAVAEPASAAESVLQPVVLTIAKPVEAYAEADKPRVYDDVDEQL